MIALIRGEVEHITGQSALITAHGVGYEVLAPVSVLTQLRHGTTATLHTSMVVREDSMTLYGFLDRDTKAVFETITSITGIGPKIGLAILSVHDVDSLALAVRNQDRAALKQVPGIGPKSAERMLLELKDKLKITSSDPMLTDTPTGRSEALEIQVVQALQSLGWKEPDAQSAWEKVLADQPELVSEGNVSQLLKAALQSMARSR